MITKEMYAEALETAFDGCAENCLHAKAVGEMELETALQVAVAVKATLETNAEIGASRPITVGAFFNGLHVGYRLRELEEKQEKDADKDSAFDGSLSLPSPCVE